MESILFLRVVKTIVGLLGIFGNSLVCVVIYKVPFMHSLTNALIFNQAAVDLFGSVVLLLASNIPVPDPLPNTPAGWILCRIWIGNLFLWGAFSASTLNLLSVTMERFFAIVFPFRHTRFFTRRLVIILTVGSWVVGIAEQGVYIAVVQDFVDGRCFFESSSRTRPIGTVFIILQFFVPVFLMFLAYIAIIYVLVRSAKRVGVQPHVATASGTEAETGPVPHRVESQGGSLLRAGRNTFKTLLIVTISYFICWAPNSIIFFLFNLGWPLDFTSVSYIISVSLVAVNSCINPVIYGIKYKRFRQGLRKLFGLGVNVDLTSIIV
ncbi:galanin receptor 2b-like [Patiria miniata]|uniref:G-protein coupled receptors family 1 profile domain-containing protein n=1 Tax=Patiria miniata TaxID=46514 RepID=A0A913ZUS5_PATMI|nr:galanin receptor 2b-like [Patiria miniata]